MGGWGGRGRGGLWEGREGATSRKSREIKLQEHPCARDFSRHAFILLISGASLFWGLVRHLVLGLDCATQPSPRREKSRTRGNNGMEKWRAISPTRMARTLAAKVKPLATNTGMEKWSATPGKVPHAWRTWPNKGRSPCGELRSARGPLFCAYKGSLPLRLFGPLSSPSSAGL